MKYKQHPYQKKATELCVKHTTYGLLADPGLGKTSIILEAYRQLKKQGHVKAALVIAPLDPMYDTWPQEIKKWDSFKHMTVSILHGSHKDRALDTPADIYLINPAGLPWLYGALGKTWPFDMLIVDESHDFKNGRTQRFKTLKKILRQGKFESRYILTGTPVPNSLLDLYGQIYILDMGDALGQYYTHFRNRFFTSDYMGFNWYLKDSNAEVIYEMIDHLVVRLDADDYLKLPELTIVEKWFDLPPAARKAYDELEREFIIALDAGIVTASNAGVLTGKLRQAANGCIYGENNQSMFLHNQKSTIAANLIREMSGQKAVISYSFNNERDLLRNELKKVLGREPPYIGGNVSKTDRALLLKQFKDSDLQVLLGQVSSISIGLNLQAAHNLIMHSMDWNMARDHQLIRRLWRQGQKHPVIVHKILARNTIDEDLMESHKKKFSNQKNLLDYLKKKYL